MKKFYDNEEATLKVIGAVQEDEKLLVCFSPNNEEILKINNNGDFFYRGKLIENDKKVVEAFRDFLRGQGYLRD